MEKEVIFNSDLHFEHEQWSKELLFWEDVRRAPLFLGKKKGGLLLRR